MQINQNIAIIGAGIAGLSFATALQNAGFKVTVLEQSRAVSGRLSTRVAESWPINQSALFNVFCKILFK